MFAVCGLSLTVLTGWAGQLSLGQMAFAGLGALLAAALTRGFALGIGWRDDQLFDVHVHSMPSLLAIAISTLLVAGLAALIGLGALRVRGSAARGEHVRVRRRRGSSTCTAGRCSRTATRSRCRSRAAPCSASTCRRSAPTTTSCLVVLAVALVVVARLRRSGIGRTTIAVRDNADTAAGYTRRGLAV